MKRKVITISIDEETYKKLKEHAKNHGDISHTIETAVNLYLSSLHTHKGLIYMSDKIITPGNNKRYQIYLDIIRYIKDHQILDYPNLKVIPLIILKQVIEDMYGIDPRTVKKYLDIIKPYIKYINDKQIELS
ncbi:MAG: hypothetical protein QXW71_01030 [Thermoplasmata archaeon]